jgi:hypothetical protein
MPVKPMRALRSLSLSATVVVEVVSKPSDVIRDVLSGHESEIAFT